jgi:methionyl-tRNA synthetase
VELDAALEQDLAGLESEVADLLDRAEITQALERIWVRVRRLNRYVEERAPWQQAKDPEQAGALDVTLASLYAGLVRVTQQLEPYMPTSCATLLQALEGERVEKIPPLFPKQQ